MRMDSPRPRYDAQTVKPTEEILREAREQGVEGAMRLGSSIQRWLFNKEGGNPQFWGTLTSASEFGARVWTMLDGATRNIGYYRGNFQAWLGRKGFETRLAGRDRDVRTTMTGNNFASDYLFNDPKRPEDIARMARDLKTQLTAEEATLPYDSSSFNKAALHLVAETFDAIGFEIEEALKGRQLPKDAYEPMLTQPLREAGILLEKQPSV